MIQTVHADERAKALHATLSGFEGEHLCPCCRARRGTQPGRQPSAVKQGVGSANQQPKQQNQRQPAKDQSQVDRH
jgi:hypothetical protein